MNWLALYERALGAGEAAAGYYNRNVGLLTDAGKVNVRIPLEAADTMDVRVWREEDVLSCIGPYVGQVPGLRHVSLEPRFQVHHFVEGRVLDGFSPRGSAVPAHVTGDVVALMAQLVRIPREKAPALPSDWPESGDGAAFGRRLAALTQRVYDTHRDEYGHAFEEFGIPEQPLAVVERRWDTLTSRPFAVLHSDLHRKNMIVSDGLTWFLDWELALWGDPLYEVAVHFHKMDYPDRQRAEVLRLWQERLPAACTAGPAEDLDLYLAHERIKSAIVDTVRYAKQLADADESGRAFLTGRLARKLNVARTVWGGAPEMTQARVARILAPWVGRKSWTP
ncbi:phosphotransferase family protein [Streptomyces antimicrobicus]|uniref:Phosphotransferase n=1 Tax=Streptomyces antimicrobicus TaxID=2883108 RepID=A0ABS8BDC4_9ACTN|nr:phosphotransferase [Streptomyces antimicrobicus]MCB5182644.1 phosphotransferase [Streptomyces antimicrobicus]